MLMLQLLRPRPPLRLCFSSLITSFGVICAVEFGTARVSFGVTINVDFVEISVGVVLGDSGGFATSCEDVLSLVLLLPPLPPRRLCFSSLTTGFGVTCAADLVGTVGVEFEVTTGVGFAESCVEFIL